MIQVPIENTPASLIAEIRYATGQDRWMNGDCFKLFRILKAAYPQAEPYYDGGHIYTEIDGIFYDIRGSHAEMFSHERHLSTYDARVQRDAWEWKYEEQTK